MDKQTIKAFLEKPYPGWKDFMRDFIVPLFEGADVDDQRGANALNPDLLNMAKRSGISDVKLLAEVSALPAEFKVYDVTVSDRVCLQRNRVTVQQLIRKIVGQGSAFMVFHYKGDQSEWRFSFCQKIADAASNAKRHTFLLGKEQNVRTVTTNFMQLRETLSAKGYLEDADLIKCFDVEALSKEFFAKYKKFYEKFVDYASKHGLKALYKQNAKAVRDYIKKMMGRLVFLQFLQKKGWLGVPKGAAWGAGDRQFLQNLFKAATPQQKDAFLDEILEHIFFHALNDSSRADGELFDTKVKAYGADNGKVKVPYLNGGLFESDQEDASACAFPKEYFSNPDDAENNPGLLDFFSQYNFTIDENDPTEAEVGVDPEMLSCIFENLLEDNKDKGAYYTPKAIVEYMCRESLTAYLQTDAKDGEKDKIAAFVKSHDAEPLSKSLAKSIDSKLRKVKICDPAIGSGAFPMGLLRELQLCRTALEDDTKSAAEIKKEIIQNNIYGVDIEKGAVDIARLRFWLSLVVDEPTPAALPNLDFKIMQGNSLLESYKGVDLSGLLKVKVTRKPGPKSKQKYVPMEFSFDSTDAQGKIANLIRDYFEAGSTERKKGILRSVDGQVRCYLKDFGAELSDNTLSFQNDQFFLWHTWFNDVFAQGGFDIVIGNPPYGVSIQGDYRKDIVSELGRCPDYEIYYYFIELAKRLTAANGFLSYIVPNTWLFNTFAKTFRINLFDHWELREILDCSRFKIFESATVMNSILLFEKQEGRSNIVGYRPTGNAVSFEGLTKEPFATILRDELLKMNQNWGLAFRLEAPIIAIVNKIAGQKGVLSDYFDCSQGYIPYRLSDLIEKYGKKEGKAIKEERKWHSPVQTKEHWIRELYGRDISKYGYESTGEYVNYGKHVATYVDMRFFANPRLIVREITNPTIIATLISETYLNDPQLLPILPKEGSAMSLKTLWAILNSRLATYFHFRHSPKATKGAFPKILIQDIKEFPMPASVLVKQEPIVRLVDQIFGLKAKDPQANTSELELKIDTLVYDLYGLTEEEIAVVEGK